LAVRPIWARSSNNKQIMNIGTILNYMNKVTCWLRRLFRNIAAISWFFLNKKSKVVYFDISSDELFAYTSVNVIQEVSNYIETLRQSDLNYIDQLALQSDFWDGKDWSPQYRHLRYLLKLGWVIKDIKENGTNNPIQLLQAADNKYIAHPGTARLLVLSYIIPTDRVKIFYVWDNFLDQDPFFCNRPYTEITNPISFLKIFKKSKDFMIKATTLTDKLICEDGGKYAYFEIANNSLKLAHCTYSLDFITCIDPNHWESHIKHKIFFKDIISFDNNKCTFGGVKFTKINDIWITDDKH
jgi:hypothetical protein